MSTFTVSILTPESVFAEKQVTMVVLPGSEGEFGVLADHIPIISKLGPGIIQLYDGKTLTKSAFIYGGFAEFSDNKLSVLADQIKEISQLNVVEAKRKIEELNKILSTSLDINYNEQLMGEIRIYQQIIDIAK